MPSIALVGGPDFSILLGMLCDKSSLFFALHGASPCLMQNMLASHYIPFSGLSYDLCCQALCHYLANGLCACASGLLCALVLGGLPPLSFAVLAGQRLFDLVTDPTFPLQILWQIGLELGFWSSGASEHSDLVCWFQGHNLWLTSSSPENPSDFFVSLESAAKGDLLAQAAAHGLSCAGMSAEIKDLLSVHFSRGTLNFFFIEFLQL
jgi:hypothetical protein